MEIRMIKIVKEYKSIEHNYIHALENISLDIYDHSYISFVGPSGSGKSTLINIITGILKPTSGKIYWGKYCLQKTTDKFISMMRRRHIGIVFQDNRFAPGLSVEENILLPLVINGTNIAKKKKFYYTLLEKLRVQELIKRHPNQLSGGERRKVAIVRALISNPELLIADEPTSNLDEKTAKEVFEIFYNLNKVGLSIVVATHDVRFAKYAKETYFLSKGKVVDFVDKKKVGRV